MNTRDTPSNNININPTNTNTNTKSYNTPSILDGYHMLAQQMGTYITHIQSRVNYHRNDTMRVYSVTESWEEPLMYLTQLWSGLGELDMGNSSDGGGSSSGGGGSVDALLLSVSNTNIYHRKGVDCNTLMSSSV